MKKLLIILLIVAIVAGVGVGLYSSSGKGFDFVDTYVQNFKDNLFNLRLKYELQKEKNNPDNTDIESPEPQTAEQTDAAEKEEEVANTQLALKKEFKTIGNPIALDGAADARYSRFMNGILCVLENSVDMYSENGTKKWSKQIQISNPVLKVNGTYFLLFEQGGRKLEVYNDKKLLYSVEATENILNGNISANGDCVIVTEKTYYKGAVSVYNKSGEEVFSRSFGSESIISAAISDSRRLAVSLLSVRTQAYSKIVFFDINKEDEGVSVEYDNTIFFDLEYSGNTLIAYGDDKMVALKSSGKEDWVFDYNLRNLNHYANDNSNIRLMMFDNNNNAEMSVITASGKEKRNIKTDVIPDFCDICDGYVIYNDVRNLCLSRLDGEAVAKYSASRDIQKAYFIDADNILIVYNHSLEFLSAK